MTKEVIDAVESINSDIYDVLGGDEPAIALEYSTTGYSEAVTFFGGPCIWSSEGEGFPYSEDGITELPFEPYLRGLVAEFFANIARCAAVVAPKAPTVEPVKDAG